MTALDVPRIGCELLSIFNWITPLFKTAQTIKHDPTTLNSWTFFIPNTKAIHKGWSQWHIKRLLEDNGIKMYGDYVSFGELSFHVPISQAHQAEEIMNRCGIPIKRRSQGAPRQEAPKPQRSYSDTVFKPTQEPAQCAYCGSFDMRKGKCHNCGGI